MAVREEEELDVDVVLKAEYACRNGEAVEQLRAHGLAVVGEVSPEGVIEGTIRADRLADLKRLDCVAYVRSVFPYVAEGGDDAAGEPPPG
jgi:hypothetical protein